MNWPMIVAASFIGLIVVALLVARHREVVRWNKGVCAQCGTNWEDAGGDWDTHEYHCGCVQHHRMSISLYGGAVLFPIPLRMSMLRRLDALVNHTASDDMLRAVLRARLALADADGDYADLDLAVKDGGHVVFSRTRGSVFTKVEVTPMHCTVTTVDKETLKVRKHIIPQEALPRVFQHGGLMFADEETPRADIR